MSPDNVPSTLQPVRLFNQSGFKITLYHVMICCIFSFHFHIVFILYKIFWHHPSLSCWQLASWVAYMLNIHYNTTLETFVFHPFSKDKPQHKSVSGGSWQEADRMGQVVGGSGRDRGGEVRHLRLGRGWHWWQWSHQYQIPRLDPHS